MQRQPTYYLLVRYDTRQPVQQESGAPREFGTPAEAITEAEKVHRTLRGDFYEITPAYEAN